MPHTIAIGDIHGCLAALDALLVAIRPGGRRHDRHAGRLRRSRARQPGTIERLLTLGRQCRLVPLLGNHDEMLLLVHDGCDELFDDWLRFGGDATLASYGTRRAEDLPPEHVAFLRGCRLWHETDRHFFVHGNYLADTALDRQPRETLLWESLKSRRPGPHRSGKTAIVGHTSQKNGEILDLGYLKCIDTCCYGQGWLTALDVDGGRVWQADKEGGLGENWHKGFGSDGCHDPERTRNGRDFRVRSLVFGSGTYHSIPNPSRLHSNRISFSCSGPKTSTLPRPSISTSISVRTPIPFSYM